MLLSALHAWGKGWCSGSLLPCMCRAADCPRAGPNNTAHVSLSGELAAGCLLILRSPACRPCRSDAPKQCNLCVQAAPQMERRPARTRPRPQTTTPLWSRGAGVRAALHHCVRAAPRTPAEALAQTPRGAAAGGSARAWAAWAPSPRSACARAWPQAQAPAALQPRSHSSQARAAAPACSWGLGAFHGVEQRACCAAGCGAPGFVTSPYCAQVSGACCSFAGLRSTEAILMHERGGRLQRMLNQ